MHVVGGQSGIELGDIFADRAMHALIKGADAIGDEFAMIGQRP